MEKENLKEQSERIKQETAYEEEYKPCEFCGGELKTILVGDEIHDKCIDCGRINN